MAPHINNIYTYFSLIAIVILLFLNTNPLIALFFGIAAIIFVMRSRNVDHRVMAPSTFNKSQNMASNLLAEFHTEYFPSCYIQHFPMNRKHH